MGNFSRREFLASASALFTILALSSCDYPRPTASFSPELSGLLSTEELLTIQRAFVRYTAAYTPSNDQILFGIDTILSTPKAGEQIEESSIPGRIDLNSQLIKKARITNSQWTFLVDATAHALTHATKPPSPKPIDKFIFDKNHYVTAYQGLFLVTDIAQENFTAFEEGLAEALAKKIYPNYNWTTGYRQLGFFTYTLLEPNLTAAAKCCQTSNVPGFVKLASGGNQSIEQIKHLAAVFQEIRDGGDANRYLRNRELLKP